MIYHVGPYRIDCDTYEVMRDGEVIATEPQVFEVLVFLIENRQRVVTRDDLVEAIWKGRHVSDAAISSRISSARKAVGDDGRSQAAIRTIHGRGFQFVAAVEALDDQDPVPASAVVQESARPDVPAPDLTGIDMRLPNRPSIVVLPFQTYCDDEQRRVLGDGLSHDIVTQLGRTRWLFVISRGTAFQFRGEQFDVGMVAEKLGVRYVLQGLVQVLGGRIRVHASLSDGTSGLEVWAEQYDRTIDDIFAVQDDISSQIVGTVESEIEQSERGRALISNPSNLDAWGAYHRGCWHMYRFRPEDYEEAERYFRLAVELDPNSPRAFAGLSFVHWQRAFLEISRDREGEINRALDYAQHSLQLDPRDPQVHWAMGRAHVLRRDFDLAVDSLETAVDLNPNFAMGQYSLGFTQMIACDQERSDTALIAARRLSPFDPMSFAMMAAQAVNAAVEGRLQDAVDLSLRAARQPNAHYHIVALAAFCHALAGEADAAHGYLVRLKAGHPDYRIADYLRAFPYRDDKVVSTVRRVFEGLGLPA